MQCSDLETALSLSADNDNQRNATQAYHLVSGSHLFLSESSGWIITSCTGDWVRVDANAQQLALLQSLLMTEHPDLPVQMSLAREQGIAALLQEFIANEFVANSCSDFSLQSRSCLLVGQGELCERLHSLLAPWFATQTQVELDEGVSLSPGTLIVCVSDWEQQELFTRLDSLCKVDSGHWYPVYQDRGSTYCGPILGITAACSYDDLRYRRMANASQPGLQEDYQRWLLQTTVPPAQLSWQQIKLITAVIMQDLLPLSVSPANSPMSQNEYAVQHAVVHADGGLRSHCILPLPVGCAT